MDQKPARSRPNEILKFIPPQGKEVLRLLVCGHTAGECAKQLGLSVKTVENHRIEICDMLLLKKPRVVNLIWLALKMGWVDPHKNWRNEILNQPPQEPRHKMKLEQARRLEGLTDATTIQRMRDGSYSIGGIILQKGEANQFLELLRQALAELGALTNTGQDKA